MGYYRGVPQDGYTKRRKLDRLAAAMRAFNLSHGRGCRTRAKAIAKRLAADRAGADIP